jgi:hypothetical protein
MLVLHLDEIRQLLHSFEFKEVNTGDMTSFTSFFFFQIMGPYNLRVVQSQNPAISLRHCTTVCARCPQAFRVEMLLINVLVVVGSFATFCEWGRPLVALADGFETMCLVEYMHNVKYSLLVVVCM